MAICIIKMKKRHHVGLLQQVRTGFIGWDRHITSVKKGVGVFTDKKALQGRIQPEI
jgi:hypothetical protein